MQNAALTEFMINTNLELVPSPDLQWISLPGTRRMALQEIHFPKVALGSIAVTCRATSKTGAWSCVLHACACISVEAGSSGHHYVLLLLTAAELHLPCSRI
jgi:hypothetical protein